MHENFYYKNEDFVLRLPEMVEISKDLWPESTLLVESPNLQKIILNNIEQNKYKDPKKSTDIDVLYQDNNKALFQMTSIDKEKIDAALTKKASQGNQFWIMAKEAFDDFVNGFLISCYLQINDVETFPVLLPETGEFRSKIVNAICEKAINDITLNDIMGLSLDEYEVMLDQWELTKQWDKIAAYKAREREEFGPAITAAHNAAFPAETEEVTMPLEAPEAVSMPVAEVKPGVVKKPLNDDLFGLSDDDTKGVTMISVDKLVAFKDHKFNLYQGKQLEDMVNSVRDNGIVTPIIVRVLGRHKYEILSGHNRVNAAKAVGLTEVPAIIKEGLTNDEALEIVLITNFYQRSINDLAPSERAAVIDQYYSFIKRVGKKKELIAEEEAVDNEVSSGIFKAAEKFELSGSMISRYVAINSLNEDLKAAIDNNKLDIKSGVILSKLGIGSQELLAPYLSKVKIDVAKAKNLVIEDHIKTLDNAALDNFFKKDKKELETKIQFSKDDFSRYFGADVRKSEVKLKIISILEEYLKENGQIE